MDCVGAAILTSHILLSWRKNTARMP